MDIGCRPRRSGSTRREQERWETMPATWRKWLGMTETQETGRIRWVRKEQMGGAYTTCMGTYGNGARTGIARTTTGTLEVAIPKDRTLESIGYCAAVLGVSLPGTSV